VFWVWVSFAVMFITFGHVYYLVTALDIEIQ